MSSIRKEKRKRFYKVQRIKFANCSVCHTDVHKGAFGADCKSCHTVNGFNIINQQNFDHNKTKFPLIGKHQTVKCNDCHKGDQRRNHFLQNALIVILIITKVNLKLMV